jgi:hypothetical protein
LVAVAANNPSLPQTDLVAALGYLILYIPTQKLLSEIKKKKEIAFM